MEVDTDTLYDQDSDFTTEIACTRRTLKRRKEDEGLQILAELP